MRIYVKGKVIGVENENDIVAYGDKRTKAASIIVQPADGTPICTKCFGKDKIQLCKEYLKSDKQMEMILTIAGRVMKNENATMPIYINEVHLKWILT